MSDIDLHLDRTLASLKDFQLATVSKVMELYATENHHQRVLVADEVGLGKTIVAKGVIASLLKQRDKSRPLRVTYICSNLALAEENRKKLSIFKGDDQKRYVLEPTFGRLAELALQNKQEIDNGKVLEICSLTPSTSFTVTQGFGDMRERSIFLQALLKHPRLANSSAGLQALFKGVVKKESWSYHL